MERYNLIKLGLEVVKTQDMAVEWCKRQNLLPTAKVCRRCHKQMKFRDDHGIGQFRCQSLINKISYFTCA